MSSTTGITKFLLATAMLPFIILAGCGHGSADDDDDGGGTASTMNAKIDVNVVNPKIGSLTEFRALNATSVFLLIDIVRAPIAGYIRDVYVTAGQEVKQGDKLYSIQSKEASALPFDSLFPSKGIITVTATQAGIVKEVDRQLGDYMQDGDLFCSIADKSSLVFMLDVPFEIHGFVQRGSIYTVLLPDGEKVKGEITSQIPQMDRTVQMERYVLKPADRLNIPEGLIATVNIPTATQKNAIIVPKAAILSNETQAEFWVMKAVKDSLAIKVSIVKGIETKDSVEIKSPPFLSSDKILVTGNYGVPDTIKIKILNH